MNKHTPGPWEYEYDECDYSNEIVIKMGSALKDTSCYEPHHMITFDAPETQKELNEALHNACLITAAPDLLEACKVALEIIEREHKLQGRYHNEMSVLFAAIDKAEGRVNNG